MAAVSNDFDALESKVSYHNKHEMIDVMAKVYHHWYLLCDRIEHAIT